MPGSSSWRLLQHWVNTLPPESCALVSSPEDLTDGQVLCDIVTLLDASAADKLGAAGGGLPRLRALIAHLGEKYGYNRLPRLLSTWDAAELLHSGNPGAVVSVVQYLRGLHSARCGRGEEGESGRESSIGNRRREEEGRRQHDSNAAEELLAMRRELDELDRDQEERQSMPVRRESKKGRPLLPTEAQEGLSVGRVREAVRSLKARRSGGRGARTSDEEAKVLESLLEEEVERERRREGPREEEEEEEEERGGGGGAMRVQAPRSPARGTSRPLPPSSPAAAASSPGRSVSRGRARRSAAGGVSVESRPGWNASTAVEREGRTTRKRKGRRAEDAAAEVWRQAGRLDESFQFVRGLQLQTMYDPTYRPAAGSFRPKDDVDEGGRGEARAAAAATGHPGLPVLESVRASLCREAGNRRSVDFAPPPAAGPDDDEPQRPAPSAFARSAAPSGGGKHELPRVRPETAEGRCKILAWLRGLGLRVSTTWYPKDDDDSGRGGAQPGHKPKEDLRLRNGVLLCELAAALEARHDAATARSALRFVGDGRFLIQGATLAPRNHAQVFHNVERALEVFRRLPREANTRHFFSAMAIAKGDEQLLWSLLGDLYDATQPAIQSRHRAGRSLSPTARASSPSSPPHRRPATSPPYRSKSPSRRHALDCSADAYPRGRAPRPTTTSDSDEEGRERGGGGGGGGGPPPSPHRHQGQRGVAWQQDHHSSPTNHRRGSASPASSPARRRRGGGGQDNEDEAHHRSASAPPPARAAPPRRTRKRATAAASSSSQLPLPFSPHPLPDPLPPVTRQQRSLVRSWLHSLGLDPPPADDGISEPVGDDHGHGHGPHLLDDPMRNGLFLCRIFTALEPEAAEHAQVDRLVHRRPSCLRHVQDNVARAIWLFKIRRCPPLPSRYLTNPQGLILGQPDLLWGLLWHIREAYLPTHGDATWWPADLVGRERERQVVQGLGYTITQKRLLERSLLHWLAGLGLLSDDFYGARLQDLYPLESCLRDGTLLCRLVERVTGHRVAGWIRAPRSRDLAHRNVRKAIDALRRWPAMGRRHVAQGAEDAIAAGEWAALLGLLEDVHRAADGLPPRPLLPEGGETPYLGGTAALPPAASYADEQPPGALLLAPPYYASAAAVPPQQHDDDDDDEDLVRFADDSSCHVAASAHDADPLGRGREADLLPLSEEPRFDVVEADDDDLDTLANHRQPSAAAAASSSWGGGGEDLLPLRAAWEEAAARGGAASSFSCLVDRTEDLIPEAWGGPSSSDSDNGRAEEEEQRQAEEERGRRTPTAPEVDMGPAGEGEGDDEEEEQRGRGRGGEGGSGSPGGGEEVGLMESFISGSSASTIPQRLEDEDEEEEGAAVADPPTDGQAARERVVRELVRWMASYGIKLQEPDALLSERAGEFGDGVVLARLVEKLEMPRGGLRGVDMRPRTRAQRLQNLRRVLAILQTKQLFPLRLVHSEFQLLEGDTEVIVPLLQHARKAYCRGGHAPRKPPAISASNACQAT